VHNIITDQFDQIVSEFLQQHGMHHVIAFSGGASTDLPGVAGDDPLQARYAEIQKERETRIVRCALNILRHHRIAVLTGGTRFGFPKTAAEVAKEMGLKTIGVFPATARDKGHVLKDLDLSLCVEPLFGESAWGDESSVFCKLLDAVIVCGGGAGTLIEASHLLKMNESLLKYEQPLKIIIPIQGTGGVADGLPFVWGKQEIKTACMPQRPVFTGQDAAIYIQERLDLYTL
jgi:predicted Rossmann-fold nucleotide-binding protein